MATASNVRSQSARSQTVAAVQSLVVEPLRFVSFWLAIVLPFALLGLLTSGILTRNALAVGGLLAVNCIALLVGQGYNRT
jgi:hypothetical protein